MRRTIYRYFDNGKIEEINWILAGTETVAMDDGRCRPIGVTANNPNSGQSMDNWLPVSVKSAAFSQVSTQTLTGTKLERRAPDWELKEYNTYTETIDNFDYNTPLKPGYNEITEEQYKALFVGV